MKKNIKKARIMNIGLNSSPPTSHARVVVADRSGLKYNITLPLFAPKVSGLG
ncbi:hypothetical protein ACFLVW_05030 [Chloroflexota bacterium]